MRSEARHQLYVDRRDAGRRLVEGVTSAIATPAAAAKPWILALPRGGVPVGYEIATALRAPLDVLIVRKLGAPGSPELAMGALASGGAIVWNESVLDALRPSPHAIERVIAEEITELERRERTYRGNRAAPSLAGRVVVLVDDGLATGATMRAAIAAVKTQQPARLVVAIPVGEPATIRTIAREVDVVVCPWQPEDLCAIGNHYADFAPTTDSEVVALLSAAAIAADEAEPRAQQ
jgi:putative phosphoribosyl transferase